MRRGKENRVSAASAMELLSHGVYPNWDLKSTERMLALLDSFLKKIPVLLLECTPEPDAVEALYKALENLPL